MLIANSIDFTPVTSSAHRMTQITNIKWNDIAEDIAAEKCILILGEDAFLDTNAKPINLSLREELMRENKDDILRHYADDLYLFNSEGNKRSVVKTMRRFYSAQEPHPLLAKLAKIPFHTFLTVTPDLLLQKTFQSNEYSFQSGFFQRIQAPVDLNEISAQNPLIFNLMGSVEDHESLVLTHADLFEFFECVMTRNGFPQSLRNTLQSAENLLFLGVPFDRWYLQVLLRILNIKRDFSKIQSFAAKQQVHPEVLTLCQEQFKINFVDQDISEFVDKLTAACQANGTALRTSKTNSKISPLENTSSWLSEGRLEEAAKSLAAFFKDKDQEQYKMAILLCSRCNRLEMKINAGIIDRENEKLEFNHITHALIDLLEDAKLIQN